MGGAFGGFWSVSGAGGRSNFVHFVAGANINQY